MIFIEIKTTRTDDFFLLINPDNRAIYYTRKNKSRLS